MKKKVAIFVDWENVRKRIFEEAYRKMQKKVDYNWGFCRLAAGYSAIIAGIEILSTSRRQMSEETPPRIILENLLAV
jgi:hypothetical protein